MCILTSIDLYDGLSDHEAYRAFTVQHARAVWCSAVAGRGDLWLPALAVNYACTTRHVLQKIRGARVHSQPETVLWFRFLCKLNLSNIRGFRMVVVYTGMANAVRSGLTSEQVKPETAGKAIPLCRLFVLGVLQLPRNANPITFMSTPCPWWGRGH